jgi:hypothetical protein
MAVCYTDELDKVFGVVLSSKDLSKSTIEEIRNGPRVSSFVLGVLTSHFIGTDLELILSEANLVTITTQHGLWVVKSESNEGLLGTFFASESFADLMRETYEANFLRWVGMDSPDLSQIPAWVQKLDSEKQIDALFFLKRSDSPSEYWDRYAD